MITLREPDLRDFLARRPAPAIGPAFTLGAGAAAALARQMARDPGPKPDWHQLVIEHAPSPEIISRTIAQLPLPPLVDAWADVSWPAVLSLVLDSRFEQPLRIHQDKHPARYPVSVLDSLTDPIPDRCLPVFRLLGMEGRATAATTRAIYLQRRAKWRYALQAFAAVTRGSPILLMGFAEAPSLLYDLLSESQAGRTLQPQAFCLFADDPLISQHPQAIDVMQSLGKTVLLDLPPQLFSSRVASTPATQPRPKAPILNLQTLSEYVAVVNDYTTPTAAPNELNRLLDLLASPSTPDWNPFAYDLDLPRTANDFTSDIRSIVGMTDFRSQSFIVSGASATGKTTLLKRVAFDLAKSGRAVLWLRPQYASDAPEVMKSIFRSLSNTTTRAIIVMDDPLAFPSLTTFDVAAAARQAQVAILLLVAVRTTDRHFAQEASLTGGLPVAGERTLPDQLDVTELALLPAYLTKKVHLAKSEEDARKLLPPSPTSDVLALLHFLFPQTRVYIEKSVRDEYFRLGDTAALTPLVSDAYSSGGQLLQHAYRLVAVATHYRAPLPIEVLVQALNVPYSDWLDAAPPSSPAWGLLYPDQTDIHSTVLYRTRNTLVADELRKLINGGTINRSGEVAALAELLSVCNGSQSLYREFTLKVLVSNPTFQELSYEDGVRLLDNAINALPVRDQTLLHHKARWIRRKGPSIREAFPVLDEALVAPPNPYHPEQVEHIHTTYASTILTALKKNEVSIEAAKIGINDHLDKASSDSFLNLHAIHVRAETTLEFLELMPKSDAVDRATLTTKTLDDVARTLLMIQHGSDVAELASSEDMSMLETVQTKLIESVGFDAEDQWKRFGSQAGYVANARQLLEYAATRAKGTDYNAAWQYAKQALASIESSGKAASAQLHEVLAEIYYRWRIQRRVKRMSDPIDWSMFKKHVEGALRGRDTKKSTVLQYLLTLALCHEGNWPEANAIFARLRAANLPLSVLWLPRDGLLTPDGTDRRIQGTVKSGANATLFFVSPDIGLDCRADRKSSWPLGGEVHANIRFAFAGPMAYRSL